MPTEENIRNIEFLRFSTLTTACNDMQFYTLQTSKNYLLTAKQKLRNVIRTVQINESILFNYAPSYNVRYVETFKK